MKPVCCIWDWNGTLLDDVQLCVDTMNGMLEKRGLPLLDLARYREIFTFPVEEYYRRAGFDFEKEPFPRLAEEYIVPYNRAALSCGLFPDARAALEQLRRQGVRQVLVSASHRRALREQVEQQGIGEYFEELLGLEDSLGAGKAGLARQYLHAHGLDPARTWCIGDTLHDREVARETGCHCVLISRGHQSPHRLPAPTLATLSALPDFFLTR